MGTNNNLLDKESPLFEKEETVIREGEAYLGGPRDSQAHAFAYAALLNSYKSMVNQTKRLMRLGDSQQHVLKRSTVELSDKADLLAATLDTLNQEIEQRKMLEQELRHRASTDALTGVFSRRAVFESGELEIKRMERNGSSLVVLILDIDHFKAINDNYGHPAGDEVLRIFSRSCQDSLREVDVFGRIGGEEFVAIMPDTSLEAALIVARRICSWVAETKIQYGSSSIGITVSIGVSEARHGESSFGPLLAQADEALYAAKNNGRNRIEVYGVRSIKNMEAEPAVQAFSLDIDYPVIFNRNIFSPDNPTLSGVIRRREKMRLHSVGVVIDLNVATAWPGLAEKIRHYFSAYENNLTLLPELLLVPGGEVCKNMPEQVSLIHRWLLDAKLDRQSVLLAIGGGAVLDMAGYAAATFHRGLRLVRMPTTVLAQNDAGIGVKNGVNTFGVKNLIGCFAAPFGVICDFDFLDTLETRDKRAGLAEAVKVALIRDREFFFWLKQQASELAAFAPAETEIMIRRCAGLHLAHITKGGDPFEFGSSRPLDFGHWAAHKLEAMTDHRLRHGEAVAIGIALDSCYSNEIGLLKREQAESICALLEAFGFTLWDDVLDYGEGRKLLLNGLAEFREHLGGELTLTMLADIGRGVEVHSIDHISLENSLDTLSRRKRK